MSRRLHHTLLLAAMLGATVRVLKTKGAPTRNQRKAARRKGGK